MTFTDRLYSIFSETGDNFLVSPYSIEMALCMVRHGARGRTLDEMSSVLGIDNPPYIEVDTLNVANAVWTRCPTNPNWAEYVKTIFRSTTMDISGLPCPEDIINNWVSIQTKGKIKDLIKRLEEDELMVITNAVYFKGKWLHQFSKTLTVKDSFYGTETTNKVDIMHLQKDLSYAETEDLQIVELPYNSSRLSMVIMLPKSRSGRVSQGTLLKPPNAFGGRSVPVILRLPKFRLEVEYNLNKVLGDMGMPLAFSDYADFTGISTEERLKISGVVHKTFIEVDEEGTEAAAATSVVMARLACVYVPPPPVEVRVDHPFVFFIRDRLSNTVLFVGAINNL